MLLQEEEGRLQEEARRLQEKEKRLQEEEARRLQADAHFQAANTKKYFSRSVWYEVCCNEASDLQILQTAL